MMHDEISESTRHISDETPQAPDDDINYRRHISHDLGHQYSETQERKQEGLGLTHDENQLPSSSEWTSALTSSIDDLLNSLHPLDKGESLGDLNND